VPQALWHQLPAAPFLQNSGPFPQKLLPEQQRPLSHLALTMGPQGPPTGEMATGGYGSAGGGFTHGLQSWPHFFWQPVPQ